MKKLIILIEIIILILLIYIAIPKQGNGEEPKYFIMTSTAYSRHPNCIAPKYDDGFTSTMTPVREGVVAINVDWIDDKWQVRSPLKLGDKIYIKGMGNYNVEDTGKFAERNHKQDYWTIDIYMESYEKAIEFGRQLRKVYILND